MHLPGFVDFLIKDTDHRAKCFSNLTCLVCALYRTYLNMSLHKTFKPTGLFNSLPSEFYAAILIHLLNIFLSSLTLFSLFSSIRIK